MLGENCSNFACHSNIGTNISCKNNYPPLNINAIKIELFAVEKIIQLRPAEWHMSGVSTEIVRLTEHPLDGLLRKDHSNFKKLFLDIYDFSNDWQRILKQIPFFRNSLNGIWENLNFKITRRCALGIPRVFKEFSTLLDILTLLKDKIKWLAVNRMKHCFWGNLCLPYSTLHWKNLRQLNLKHTRSLGSCPWCRYHGGDWLCFSNKTQWVFLKLGHNYWQDKKMFKHTLPWW